jgi:hypothetical protein
MIWSLDKSTEVAARCHPLPIAASEPAKQWPGHPTKASTWNDRVIQPAIWPAPSLQSSPDQIMEFFQKELYTQAVAMVVSWGGMGRRSRDIYRQRSGEDIQRIEKAIRFSAGHPQLWVDIRRLDRPYRKIRRRTRLVGGHDLKDAPFPL